MNVRALATKTRVKRSFVVICSVGLALTMTSPVIGASTSPKTLNLRSSDLPAGFTQTLNTWVSDAAFARDDHVSVGTLRAEGRVISYEVAFGGLGPDGFLGVLAGVTKFKTLQGARQDYALEAGPTRRELAAHPKHVSVVAFSTVGDARIGFKTPDTMDGKPVEGCSVQFHRGRYWAIVLAYTLPNRNPCGWTEKYAHVIDVRIEAS